MKIARLVAAGAAAMSILLGPASLAQQIPAQQMGTVTGINRINGTIAIKQTQGGTVGANTGGMAEEFKVQQDQSLEDLHAGNRVSFSTTTDPDGTRTITRLRKQ